jgi:hypothetical protein
VSKKVLIREKMIVEEIAKAEGIESKILLFRGQKVMIDRDLAEFYDVATKRLNEQVKRNRERFPADFMFQLNAEEKNELVANCGRFKSLKHSTSLPFAFTEHGAVMLASVLNSSKAVEASIYVAINQLLMPPEKTGRKIGF